jgi:hypothetical protein
MVVTIITVTWRGVIPIDLSVPRSRRRSQIDGLRLVAADGPFTTGSGPLVSGTTVALILAMTGRTTYCDELEGDGVATLRERGGTP